MATLKQGGSGAFADQFATVCHNLGISGDVEKSSKIATAMSYLSTYQHRDTGMNPVGTRIADYGMQVSEWLGTGRVASMESFFATSAMLADERAAGVLSEQIFNLLKSKVTVPSPQALGRMTKEDRLRLSEENGAKVNNEMARIASAIVSITEDRRGMERLSNVADPAAVRKVIIDRIAETEKNIEAANKREEGKRKALIVREVRG